MLRFSFRFRVPQPKSARLNATPPPSAPAASAFPMSGFKRIFFTLIFCLLILSTSPSVLVSQEATQPDLKELLKTFHAEFVLIKPGEKNFDRTLKVIQPTKKSEHTITFTQTFYIAKYEVPQNLWLAVIGSNPSRWKGARNSVELLDFDDAVEFCEKVTQLLRREKLISQNQIVRLPTELEWEYVANAGAGTKYSFGNDPDKLDDYAWYTGNAKGNDPPVGAKKPNPWGLYDVHGYLWEWTIDSWSTKNPVGELNAKAWPPEKLQPVLKSGSWKDPAKLLETRARLKVDRKLKDDAVGLRCLLTADPKPAPKPSRK